MRLQTRLALLFGVVVTAAALVMGALSYAAISNRLEAETDDSLLEAAVPLAVQLRSGRVSGPGESRDHGHRDETGLLLPALLLLADGSQVPASTSQVTLPVDALDSQLAAAQTPMTRFQDVTIDGRPYRMVTQGAGNSAGAALVGRDASENVEVLRTLAVMLALIGLGVAGLAALAGWLLARRSARRLVELTSAAEKVAETGNLEAGVSVPGTDEIARLGASFNSMLLRLSEAQADQQRLVQDAGHELRTPLTSLRTNVSLLRRFQEMPEPTRAQVISDLDGETKELTKLVNEVIHLASAVPADTPAQRVVLSDIGAAVAERARRRTGRQIIMWTDGSAVMGQPDAIERAMWNLVENAAKFSPANTPIELRIGNGAVVVLDVGPGFDRADVDHVFDRFYRATAARSRPGSGLGLAIVREVATSHGGRCWARNRSGGGAEVGFAIPPAPAIPGEPVIPMHLT